MATYTICIRKLAEKQLRKLPFSIRRRLWAVIQSLSKNPRPQGYTKLQGSKLCRVRVGDYRIIYKVAEREVTVAVIMVGHRKEVYDKVKKLVDQKPA